jgi:ribonuclease Z
VERSVAGITIAGGSRAGIGTSLYIKEYQLCFDLGCEGEKAADCDTVFISHGHTDHLGELFNYLAIRRLHSRDIANLFVPHWIGDDLRLAIQAWGRLSASSFDYRIFEVHPRARLPLRNQWTVEAFPLVHTTPCMGYLLSQSVAKLAAPYVGLPGEEIRRLKLADTEGLFQDVERPLFAYVPDTLPEGIDALPEAVWKAKVMAIEATFLDDRKPLDKVRAGGHVRLDDLVSRLRRFSGEAVVLFHISQMYSPSQIEGLIAEAFPGDLPFSVSAFW